MSNPQRSIGALLAVQANRKLVVTVHLLQRELSLTRQISTVCGLVILVALAFVPGSLSDRLAITALAAVVFATVVGWVQLATTARAGDESSTGTAKRRRREWALVVGSVGLVAGAAVQTWFHPGTSIASIDLTPPEGIAWISRLFQPWVWTGSSLGEPSSLMLEAPWAAALAIVHVLGGSADLSQRIWFTILFIAAGLGAVALLAAMRLGPLGTAVGAVAYVFNPYVVGTVGTNHVFIAAMGLMPAMVAVPLSVGRGKLSVRLGCALIVLAAPMFGYVYQNPPLLGMVLGLMLATPLLAAWLDGSEAGLRSLRVLLIASPLLVAASLYWIVPEVLGSTSVAGGQLASLTSWDWTEARASVRNAFWLNTIWAWTYPEYIPFAASYEAFPLSLFRFLLPALAFAALAIGQVWGMRQRTMRLAVAAATLATLIIFLSTGTNPPGNFIFDFLYRLPLGWLLREPGRFLMATSLAYAVLIALVVDAITGRSIVASWKSWQRQAMRISIVFLTVGSVASLGFPEFTGSLVPDKRPLLPSAHVMVPPYWGEMAGVVDTIATPGALLVLPPDDFYQMPYTWGYYGSDAFVVNTFKRHVLNPNGQGYATTSPQVLRAVNLTAQSILDHDWQRTAALVNALRTPLILVRRDVVAPYSGRSILSPDALATALSAAPNFRLLTRIGSLELFALGGSSPTLQSLSIPATVNTQTPDLRVLSLLPPLVALLSSPSIDGIPSVVEAPPIQMWRRSGGSLVWDFGATSASSYKLAELSSSSIQPIDRSASFALGRWNVSVNFVQPRGGIEVSVVAPDATGPDGASPTFILLASPSPNALSPLRLVTVDAAYSPLWESTEGKHVLVDGLLNGWLVQPSAADFAASYQPTTTLQWTQTASAIAMLVGLVALVWPLIGNRRVKLGAYRRSPKT